MAQTRIPATLGGEYAPPDTPGATGEHLFERTAEVHTWRYRSVSDVGVGVQRVVNRPVDDECGWKLVGHVAKHPSWRFIHRPLDHESLPGGQFRVRHVVDGDSERNGHRSNNNQHVLRHVYVECD